MTKHNGRQPKAKPSTALARRRTYPGDELMPAPRTAVVGTPRAPSLKTLERGLTDEWALGAIGLVEIKITEKEEAVLARPVNVDDVRMKPTGQPYLSHPTYTRWFNDAFGRLGWAIIPCAKPALAGQLVLCPFILYVHGKPAAVAIGEQQYISTNREQSYGDAIEATTASALRRCAKRLGVGLDLWDKPFLQRYLDEHAVEVYRSDASKWQWRRKVDPPFYDEAPNRARTKRPDTTALAQEFATADVDVVGGPMLDRGEPRPPAAQHNAKAAEKITGPQLTRLHTIGTNSRRSPAAISAWLKAEYNYDSSKDITRGDYDAIVRAVESQGPLPVNPRKR